MFCHHWRTPSAVEGPGPLPSQLLTKTNTESTSERPRRAGWSPARYSCGREFTDRNRKTFRLGFHFHPHVKHLGLTVTDTGGDGERVWNIMSVHLVKGPESAGQRGRGQTWPRPEEHLTVSAGRSGTSTEHDQSDGRGKIQGLYMKKNV